MTGLSTQSPNWNLETTRFNFPTPIHFGSGVSQRVGPAFKSRGLQRPLVVTDRGVAGLPWFKEFVNSLEKAGLQPSVFSGVWGNPVQSQVQEGITAYRGHRADSMIGVGGGAALDVAKAILILVHHTGDLFQYEDGKADGKPIDKEIPYWVALPTTAGTGSEVGRSSVIADDKTHVKKIFFAPSLLAREVYADPVLTVGLPPSVTANTGMDALTHLIEAYLSKGFHPICDGIALEGIKLVQRSLTRCVTTPKDLSARGEMLVASMMGAIAFQKGLGVTHSCAHALSTVFDLHHGFANALMLTACMKFNFETHPERFDQMALCVGHGPGQGAKFISWIDQLKKEVGIPNHLREAGVTKDKFSQLVEIAVQDGCHPSNPRSVTAADFERLFHEAF